MAADGSLAGSTANRLRAHTRELHARAESAGVVRKILDGTVTRGAYALYLRNLHPVYESLERALHARRTQRGWRTLAVAEIHRAPAIAADLEALAGERWRERLALVPAAVSYTRRIDAATASDARLAAHVYTRYLGDLSGGQILAGILARALHLEPAQLATHRFEHVADLGAFRAEYRRAFDDLEEAAAGEELLTEAAVAFELNIALAEALTGYE
jgi:heme oxygenase